jgi:hypothetical protein
MDAALYFCLRDEMQQDAAQVERQLEELRSAESFLLRRMHSSRHLGSYRTVLQDLSTDISRAESEQAELLRLSRFVTRALVTAYAKEPDASRLQKPQPAKSESASPSQPGTKDAAKSNGPIAPAPGLSEPERLPVGKSASKVHAPLPPPKTGVVEFDKDGFPLVVGPGKSSAAKKPSAIAFQDTAPISEPPTVLFDENGFPLNPPASDSQNTLVENPKSPAIANPLTKKDA